MTTSAGAGPIEKVSARALVVWGVALAAYVFAVFARTSLSATGVQAAVRFHASSATLSLFTVLQLGVYAAMQVPAGTTVDRIGPRKTIAIGSSLIGAGLVALAFATDVPTAIGARVLVGSGDAFIFLSVVRLLPGWFPGRHVGLATQLTGMVGQLGQLLSLGPLVGVLNSRGWTAAFLLGGSMTLFVGALVLLVVRDGHPHHTVTVEPSAAEDSGRPSASENVSASADTTRPATPENLSASADTTRPATPENLSASASAAAAPAVARRTTVVVDRDDGVTDDPDDPDDGLGVLARTWRNPGTRTGFWVHFTMPFSSNTFALLWGFAYMTKAEHVADSVALGVLSAYVFGCLGFSPLLGVLTSRFPLRRLRLVAVLVAAQCVAWAAVLAWPGDVPVPALFVLAVALSAGGPGSLIGFDFSRSTNPLSTLGLATGMVNAAGFISSLTAVLAIGVVLDMLGEGTPDLFTDRGFAIAWLVQVPIWLLGLSMLRRTAPAYRAYLAGRQA